MWRWGLLVRWVSVGLLVLLAVVFPPLMPWPFPGWPVAAVAGLAAFLNLIWWQATRRGLPVQLLGHLQLLTDVALVSAVIQLTGGVDSPFWWLYAGAIMTAALGRGWGAGLAAAALSLGAEGLVMALQYLGALPHVHVDTLAGHPVTAFEDPTVIGITLTIHATFFAATTVSCGWFHGVMVRTARHLVSAQQDLMDQEQRLHRMLGKLVCAQEGERKRIARELHDQTGQLLAAVVAGAQELQHRIEAQATIGSGSDIARAAARTAGLARAAVDSLRGVIQDLRPPALDRLGLACALQEFLAQRVEPAGIQARLEAELSDRLPPEVETALFRATQEALVNAVKHSQARSVRVRIAPEGNEVVVQVADDGVGFDAAAVLARPPKDSLGLQGMAERVEMVGGRLAVHSSPGRGTLVEMRIPLPRS